MNPAGLGPRVLWYHPGVARSPLFGGLVVDEAENPVRTTTVGDESFYVIDDSGFKRHVDSASVDRQVLAVLHEAIRGKEGELTEEALRRMGQNDIFSQAALERSLRQAGDHLDELLERGIPEDARAWLGMVGFRVVVDLHGQVVRVDQPSAPEEPPD
ncbi:MAG: hypothetical protein WD906_02920 [Anaerolineales bacterium]